MYFSGYFSRGSSSFWLGAAAVGGGLQRHEEQISQFRLVRGSGGGRGSKDLDVFHFSVFCGVERVAGAPKVVV